VTKTGKFYAIMVLAIVILFGNAAARSARVEQRREAANIERYETLSYHECAERYHEMVKVLGGRPKTWSEYFATLHRMDMLVGAAQKAMKHSVPAFGTAEWRDADIVRSIPVEIRPWWQGYERYVNALDKASDWKTTYDAYVAAGFDPLRRPRVPDSGSDQLLFWWLMFQFGATPLVAIHYAIQMRNRGMSVWLEICCNPAFPFWLFFWEIGLFRYPMKTSPLAQLRRAQRFATVVLSSTLSCFAGTGKVCEKRERAPQHQRYNRSLVRWSFSTTTMSNYVGLDGGLFFPGVDQWTTITAKLPHGIYLSFFDAEPITQRGLRPNYGWEMDGIIGWSGEHAGYSFDFNGTYLNAFPLRQIPRGDVVQFSEKVGRKFAVGKRSDITPYVWLRQAIPVRGPTPVGGWFIHGGGTISQKFGNNIVGSVSTEVVHDSGAFGFDPGYIGRAVSNLTWKRGKHISVQLPIVIVNAPLSHTGDGRKPQISFGIGFSVSQ
jgi:hypothetical protein